MSKVTIILSGGTGGHVIPAVNFGNFLISKGFKCLLVLDKRGFQYSKNFKGNVYIINSSHLSGNLIYKLKSLINLSICFFKSLYLFINVKPNQCISFGSYATFMPLLSITILKFFFNINIYLHEQNSVIGKVNLFFLKHSKYIFTNFEMLMNIKYQYINKKIYVGLPSKQRVNINASSSKKNIFVYGGSQGSIPLINIFLKIIKKLDKKILNEVKIFVQSPNNTINIVKKELFNLNINFEVKEFYLNIDEILSLTDIAITRAGSGTIDDLIRFKIPSIIFPLPHSIYNHQYYNAKYLSDKEASILVDEKNINIDKVANDLKKLIIDYNQNKKIKEKLNNIYMPNANQLLLNKIFYENK